jgi:ribonuclease HI
MNLLVTTPARIEQDARIHFDGGTPCNIPPFGIGYGSYRINSLPIARIDHHIRCSANTAEILTLCCALDDLASKCDPGTTAVHVMGDSQNALKWVRVATGEFVGKRAKISKNVTEPFREAIRRLTPRVQRFALVTSEWKPRIHAVRVFGH